jgi:hypothetical protein
MSADVIIKVVMVLQHVWGRGEVYTGFWWRNLSERHYLEDPGVDWKLVRRWIFRSWDVKAWTGLIWLWRGTGGGLLRMQ